MNRPAPLSCRGAVRPLPLVHVLALVLWILLSSPCVDAVDSSVSMKREGSPLESDGRDSRTSSSSSLLHRGRESEHSPEHRDGAEGGTPVSPLGLEDVLALPELRRSVQGLCGGRVQSIIGGDVGFVAIKADGSVVTWGWGGIVDQTFDFVHNELRGGVESVITTGGAVAAIKSGGGVVTWGDPGRGGDSDDVGEQLRSGVRSISATGRAFAAIKYDGSVVMWGGPEVVRNSRFLEELRAPIPNVSCIKNWK